MSFEHRTDERMKVLKRQRPGAKTGPLHGGRTWGEQLPEYKGKSEEKTTGRKYEK